MVKQMIPRFQITRRLQKHKREFNRYNKEVKQSEQGKPTHSKGKQKEYSSQMASKELAIIDELEYILNVYCNQYK